MIIITQKSFSRNTPFNSVYNPEVVSSDNLNLSKLTRDALYRNEEDSVKNRLQFNADEKVKEIMSRTEDKVKNYDPKIDTPLVTINENVPIIEDKPEKEFTPELFKHKLNLKKEEFKDNMKDFGSKLKDGYNNLNENYGDLTNRESLGKDAAILAAGTAALSAGAYGLHKYIKRKKEDKKKAEKKFKK